MAFAPGQLRQGFVGHPASSETTAVYLGDIHGRMRRFRTVSSAVQGLLFGDVGSNQPIANSAALLAWPDTRADWVRPGLVLYGVSPFPCGAGADLGLRPVMTLQTEVIAVKDVRAGETVGYGGAWLAPRDTRMAVVAAGYGDG